MSKHKLHFALGAAAVAVAALGATGVAYAHHAFAAEFDANAPVLLKGKVSKVEWVNPHTWVHVDAVNDDGTETKWMVEGGTPNTLIRAGLNKKTIKIGTEVTVWGYQSKDKLCEPRCKANGRDIAYTNTGEKFFMGSSGTGAPKDGADPTETSN